MKNEFEAIQTKNNEKELEALREQLLDAQAANRAKTEYMAMISHDIRTPLNIILGMSSLARKYREDEERLNEYLEKIDSSGRYLLSLLDDVLNISQIESGRLMLEMKEFSLADMALEIVDLVQGMTEGRKQKLSFEHINLIHSEVLGDAKRLTQILVNIISNSVKYSGDGSEIVFGIEELPADDSGRGIYRFTVRDNGVGMEEEFLERIFLPYIRRMQQNRKDSGSGLGMTIAKQLVTAMDGKINVSSRINEGTKFVIDIPLWQQSRQNLLEACAAAEDFTETKNVEFEGINAILAEDNEDNAEILADMLRSLGVSFDIVSDGRQAVETFEKSAEHTYDCIFMDVQMPVMDGVEATKAIRAMEREDAGLPIFAMTANVFLDEIKRFKKEGMQDHIGKPGTVEDIAGVLGKWFVSKTKAEV